MTIDTIKCNITDKLGCDVIIICNCARNKKEQYIGKITEIYNYIFIVRLNNNDVKSFCYSDVLTNTIELDFI